MQLPITTFRSICFTAIALLAVPAASLPALATDPTPQQIQCRWKKHKKAGRYQACVQNAVVKKVQDPAFNLDAAKAACAASFKAAWDLQEAKAAAVGEECLDGAGHFDEVRAMLDAPADRLREWLADTAFEGPRFTDNGDGTVTDNQTKLMWEKKTSPVGSGHNYADPHDVDNTYNWSAQPPYDDDNGTAFTDFLWRLNGSANDVCNPDGVCFAGHCDWRLPSYWELPGIVDLAAPGCGAPSPSPCIDGGFGPTVPAAYWTRSRYQSYPTLAYWVRFSDGSRSPASMTESYFVRAVRDTSHD